MAGSGHPDQRLLLMAVQVRVRMRSTAAGIGSRANRVLRASSGTYMLGSLRMLASTSAVASLFGLG